MKKKTKLLAFGLAFMALMLPMTAYAYEESNVNVDEEGNWEVFNADGPAVSVTMYMMMQPEYSGSSGFRGTYWFFCKEGSFKWASGIETDAEPMVFHFRPDNARVVDVFSDYQIWLWEFNLEPGTYQFLAGNCMNNICLLTQSLGSSLADNENAARAIRNETMVLEEGDSIRLYAMYGDNDSLPTKRDGFITDEGNMDILMAYASQKEESLGYGKPIADSTIETQTTIEGGTQEEETAESMEEPEIEPEQGIPDETGFFLSSSEEEAGEVPLLFRMALCAAIVFGIFIIGGHVKKRKK